MHISEGAAEARAYGNESEATRAEYRIKEINDSLNSLHNLEGMRVEAWTFYRDNCR